MRKRISSLLWAVVSGVMLLSGVSCEKMIVGDDGDDDANVVLRVTSFEQVPFSLARTRRDVSEVCSRLNFIVYDEGATKRLYEVKQEKEDEGFGVAKFKLSPGKYFVVILAHNGLGNPSTTNPVKIEFSKETGFTDTFLWSDYINVGEEDLDRPVDLIRIVSKVLFEFYDEIPANASRMRFYYKGGSGSLDATHDGWGSVNSKQNQWYDINHTEEKFEIYTIPHKQEKEYLEVDAYSYSRSNDGTDDYLTHKRIDSIPILRNKITICQGFLFSPVYGAQFRINIIDNWDSETLNMNF